MPQRSSFKRYGVQLSEALIISYLQFWAWLVVRLRRPTIIGITGSVGKTTATTMIADVLKHADARATVGKVGETIRGMNNDIGLPLTILQVPHNLPRKPLKRLRFLLHLPVRAVRLAVSAEYPRVLVLEFATHWKGHLHRLAKLAPPDIGIVTTIGPAHLERLGSIDGVVREKSAVVMAPSPSGLVILGAGHDRVAQLQGFARAPVVTVEGCGIELARNIARVIGHRFGLPEHSVESAIRGFNPPKGRLNHIKIGDVTVIDDSYNANPLSMKHGLDVLAQTSFSGRKLAVLGTMGELGADSRRYHREVGEHARNRCDLLIGVGEAARDYGPDHWFATTTDCAKALANWLRPGDCLLIKGSKSVKMDDIIRKLTELRPEQPQSAAGP